MHICEFCHVEYQARAQVKHPRACNASRCQIRRQSINEREWRVRNDQFSDPEYHRVRRKQRRLLLEKIAGQLLECIEIGVRFLNRAISSSEFRPYLNDLILRLGIRRANKFWPLEIARDLDGLYLADISEIVQTS